MVTCVAILCENLKVQAFAPFLMEHAEPETFVNKTTMPTPTAPVISARPETRQNLKPKQFLMMKQKLPYLKEPHL